MRVIKGLFGKLFKERSGSVLVYVTLSMTVLLVFGAGVMDAGLMYENRRQLQNGADGAALAGAQELLRFDLSATDRKANAEIVALNYAERNGIPVSQVDPGYPQVTCVPFAYNNNCDASNKAYYNAVEMSASRHLDLMVAALLNSGLGNVGAPATAIAYPALPTEGLWPWGVSNCDDWDFDGNPECGIPEGVPIILKFSSPPGSPGNFFPLDFPNSSGASDYGESIKTGYGEQPGDFIASWLPWCGTGTGPSCPGKIDDPHVQTESGNKTGDTRTGVDYLVNQAISTGQDNPDSAWNTPEDQCTWPNAPTNPTQLPFPSPPPPLLVPYIPPGWIGGGSPLPGDWQGNASACYRVGIVPIIAQKWSQLSGKKPVDIIGWGAFYLIGRTTGPGGQMIVWGYFTDVAKVSGGKFSNTDTGLWAARLWQ